jgi:hypothetical protein
VPQNAPLSQMSTQVGVAASRHGAPHVPALGPAAPREPSRREGGGGGVRDRWEVEHYALERRECSQDRGERASEPAANVHQGFDPTEVIGSDHRLCVPLGGLCHVAVEWVADLGVAQEVLVEGHAMDVPAGGSPVWTLCSRPPHTRHITEEP